jgi:starch synthase
MKVVYAVSEISPYASTGGMADVAAALPSALTALDVEVIRVMPMYRQLLPADVAKFDTGIRLAIPVGLRTLVAEVWQSLDDGPTTYFIRKDEFFDRSYLYSLPERNYDDNFERFVFFQKSIIALIDTLSLQPDIVHANDWQTGLLSYFLDHGIQGMGRGRREKVILTIHNLAYQGVFADSEFPYSNLPYSCFAVDQLEFYGGINSLKGGIVRADQVTTVSQTYAREILTPEFGCGLEGVLTDVQYKLTGILNGVDYSVWDPANDPLIAARYTAADLSGKATCRQDLLKRMGLQAKDSSVVILGMVSRLTDQKGLDLLAESMEAIMQESVVFAMLGDGQDEYQRLCREWAERWPGRFAVHLGFNNELAHQIEAGADIFLMPSRFEPCGLNQLYSLRYGTAPVVHATGGLEDTIRDIDHDPESGNGFKFTTYDSDSFLNALGRALARYQNAAQWQDLCSRMMQEDYSWQRSAGIYKHLYESLAQG